MKKSIIQLHPRFAELCAVFRTECEWFRPWKGVLFRFQTVDFPKPADVLSGSGARMRGGRWNPPGIAAVYGSTTDTTALEESKANDRYYGVETRGPRLLVAIEARLSRVLDLTVPRIRRAMGVTLRELAAEDWRKLFEAGRESFAQAIGRAAATVGADGLVARSSAVPRGVNVVVFPGACKSGGLGIVEGEKLARLHVRKRA